MTREAVKAWELRAVQELIRRLELESQVADPGIRESPDFALSFLDGTVVGIEVTELADPSIASGDAAVARLRTELERRLADLGLPVGVGLRIGEGFAFELGVITSGSAVGRKAPFVQQCIDKKSAKIAEYRARLPGRPIWLLLVAGVAGRSAVWSVVLDSHAYASAFERTFYLDAYDGRLSELTR